MKYSRYLSCLNELADFLDGKVAEEVIAAELINPVDRPVIGDWTSDNNLPIPVRGDGIGNKSGVYFFLTEEEDVLYIGKATKDNLHERIWDHLQTPEERNKGWKTFPKTKFAQTSSGELFVNGKVKIGVVEVHPIHLTSLVEVYLQSISLPSLCKQIG